MTDRDELHAAGRAVVIAENGACVRHSSRWCNHHSSRVREGMSVCDVFVGRLGLMEEVIAAVEPLIRVDERDLQRALNRETEGAQAFFKMADLRAKIETLPIWEDDRGWRVMSYLDVVALFDGGSDAPQ